MTKIKAELVGGEVRPARFILEVWRPNPDDGPWLMKFGSDPVKTIDPPEDVRAYLLERMGELPTAKFEAWWKEGGGLMIEERAEES